MKVNSQRLFDHINKARLGGLVNEMILGKDLTFAVINEGKSVISICNKGPVNYTGGEIGIFNLELFSKAIQYARETIFVGEEEIEFNIVENRLVFKKGDDELKFLLSNPKVISSTIDNASEVLEKISQGEAVIVKLIQSVKDKCLKAIQLVNPEKCIFVSTGSKVQFFVGKETEHNVVIDLGITKSKVKFNLVVKPDFLSRVLQSLPTEKDVIIELRKNMPLVLDMEDYVFLVFPMEAESKNGAE